LRGFFRNVFLPIWPSRKTKNSRFDFFKFADFAFLIKTEPMTVTRHRLWEDRASVDYWPIRALQKA
jgi:hypothetical protein